MLLTVTSKNVRWPRFIWSTL